MQKEKNCTFKVFGWEGVELTNELRLSIIRKLALNIDQKTSRARQQSKWIGNGNKFWNFLTITVLRGASKSGQVETEIQMLCETLLLLLKIVRNIIPNLRGFYRIILVNLKRVTSSHYTCKPTGPINILHHEAVDLCFVELKVHTHDISDPNFYILLGNSCIVRTNKNFSSSFCFSIL